MEDYKIKYNNLLSRYYNGIKYIETHPTESDKYMPIIYSIIEQLEIIIIKYKITDRNIILNGFNV